MIKIQFHTPFIADSNQNQSNKILNIKQIEVAFSKLKHNKDWNIQSSYPNENPLKAPHVQNPQKLFKSC